MPNQQQLSGYAFATAVAAMQNGRKRLVNCKADYGVQHPFEESERQVEHQQAVQKAIDIRVNGLVHADDGH